jgi:hypothetical protein
MKRAHHPFVFIFFIVTLLSFAGDGHKVAGFIPQPDFAQGWRWDFEPEIYTPDNLFDYIDGEAELYNDYNFVEMATGSYAKKDDETISFSVDIYDMGSPLDAFGIYSSYRRPELDFEPIGDEAMVSDLNIRFYKGRYFVQLNGASTDPIVGKTIHQLAKDLAIKIPDAPAPQELSLLLKENQVPHSMKYITKGFMGQGAFKSTVQADYESSDASFTGFVSIFANADEAARAITAFEKNLAQQGTITVALQSTGNKRFAGREELKGNIMAQVYGNYVIGVVGFEKEKTVGEFISGQMKMLTE